MSNKNPEYRPKPTPRDNIDMAWDMAYAEKPSRDKIADSERIGAETVAKVLHCPNIYFQRVMERDTPEVEEKRTGAYDAYSVGSPKRMKMDALKLIEPIESVDEVSPTVLERMHRVAKDHIVKRLEVDANNASNKAAKPYIEEWARESSQRARKVAEKKVMQRPATAGLPTLGKNR